ncbi:hypothetical protein GJ496_010687 [Pomphorhynchus laevis]|nr:hypothetical protein GJ496_010687 [Pomphorhynchus laevis]
MTSGTVLHEVGSGSETIAVDYLNCPNILKPTIIIPNTLTLLNEWITRMITKHLLFRMRPLFLLFNTMPVIFCLIKYSSSDLERFRYSLTLIDSLDTLALLNQHKLFADAYWKAADVNFNIDSNVSVFETNIRVVGGLLSGHLLADYCGVNIPTGWPCTGPLLDKAIEVAEKLLPAFKTKTGIPYGTVNLLTGVPENETTITSVAGAGTFIIEFASISLLTGDSRFIDAAIVALDALWEARTSINLVGDHIDIETGSWRGNMFTIGSSIDSYIEYLMKGAIILGNETLAQRFTIFHTAILNYSRNGLWHVYVDAFSGKQILRMFQSLDAFYPGVMALAGYPLEAMHIVLQNHQLWKMYNCLPEHFDPVKLQPIHTGLQYPLRPEHIESIATLSLIFCRHNEYGDVCMTLRAMAVDILSAIESETRCKCGFCSIMDVRDGRLYDNMESFFIAETLKYMYIALNGSTELLYRDDHHFYISNIDHYCNFGKLPNQRYVFNTEAHLIDIFALHCCANIHI